MGIGHQAVILYDSNAYRNKLHRSLVNLVSSLPLILVLTALLVMIHEFYVAVNHTLGPSLLGVRPTR
jgi:hypothetical protein